MYFLGIGTVFNAGVVIIGGLVGLVAKRGIKPSVQDSIMKVLGIAVIFLGAASTLVGLIEVGEGGRLVTKSPMLMIISLITGVIIGELIRVEDRIDSFGVRLRKLMKAEKDATFLEGFVTNTLVICVGAMAIVGSLQDGLMHDPSMLYAKGILDCMITLIFAASLGVGAVMAAVPLFLYQGAITLLAGFVSRYLTDAVIENLSYIGSVLITCTGINLLFGKTIKVGNMLPALIMVLIFGMWF